MCSGSQAGQFVSRAGTGFAHICETVMEEIAPSARESAELRKNFDLCLRFVNSMIGWMNLQMSKGLAPNLVNMRREFQTIRYVIHRTSVDPYLSRIGNSSNFLEIYNRLREGENPFRHTKVRVDNRLEYNRRQGRRRGRGQLALEEGNDEEFDDFEDDFDDDNLDDFEDDDDNLDDDEDEIVDEDDEEENDDNNNDKNDEDGAESDDSISVVYSSVVKKPVEAQASCSKVQQNSETPHIKAGPMVRSKQNLKERQLPQVEIEKPNSETVREKPGTSKRASGASRQSPTPADSNRPGTSGSAEPSGRVTPNYVRLAKKICENRRSVPMPTSRPRRNPPRILRSSRIKKEIKEEESTPANSNVGNQRSKGNTLKRQRPPVSSPIEEKKRAVEKPTGKSKKRPKSTRDESDTVPPTAQNPENLNKRRRVESNTNENKPEPCQVAPQPRTRSRTGAQAGERLQNTLSAENVESRNSDTGAETCFDPNIVIKQEPPETPRENKLARHGGTSFGGRKQMNKRPSVAPIIKTERSHQNNKNKQGTQEPTVICIDDDDDESHENFSHKNDAVGKVQTDESPPNESSVEKEKSHRDTVNKDDDDSVICIDDDDDEPCNNQGESELSSELNLSEKDKELQDNNTESHELTNINSVQTNEKPPEPVQNWQLVQPEVNPSGYDASAHNECQGEQEVQYGDALGEDEAPQAAEEGAERAERAERRNEGVRQGVVIEEIEDENIVPEIQDEQPKRKQFKQDDVPFTKPKTKPNILRSSPNVLGMEPELYRVKYPPRDYSMPPKFLVLQLQSVPGYNPYRRPKRRPKFNAFPTQPAPAPAPATATAPAPAPATATAPAPAPAPAPEPIAVPIQPAPKPIAVPIQPAPKPIAVPIQPEPEPIAVPTLPTPEPNRVLTKPGPKCKKAIIRPTPKASAPEPEILVIDLTGEDEDEEEEEEEVLVEKTREYTSMVKEEPGEQSDHSTEHVETSEAEHNVEQVDDPSDEEEIEDENAEDNAEDNEEESTEEKDDQKDEENNEEDEDEDEDEDDNEEDSETGLESVGSISLDTSEYDGEIESGFELLSEEEYGPHDKNQTSPEDQNGEPTTSQQAPRTLAPPALTTSRPNADVVAWKAGPMKATIRYGNVMFECCMELWPFVNALFYLFIIHIGVHHSDDVWNGECSGCSGETTENGPLGLVVALKHLIFHVLNADLPEDILFPPSSRMPIENEVSSDMEFTLEIECGEDVENNCENVGVSTVEERITDARESNDGGAQEENSSNGAEEEETPNTIEGCSNGDNNPGPEGPNVENDQNVEDIENFQNPQNPNPEIEERDINSSVIGSVMESPIQECQINYISPPVWNQSSTGFTPVIPYVEFSPVVDGFVPAVPYEIHLPVYSNVSAPPGVMVVPPVIQPQLVSAFSPFVFQPSLALAPQLVFPYNFNPVYIPTATIQAPTHIPTVCSFSPLFPFESSILQIPVGDGTNFAFVTTTPYPPGYNAPGTDGSDLRPADTSFQSQNPVGDYTNPVPDDTSLIPSHSENPETDCIDSTVYAESSEPVETQSPVGECTNPVPDVTSYTLAHSEDPETDCNDSPDTLEPSQTTDGDSTNCVPVYAESSQPVETQSPVGDYTNPVPDDTSLIPSHSENLETDCNDSPDPSEPSQTTNGDSTDYVPFATASNSFSCQFPDTGDSDPPVYVESSEPILTQNPNGDCTIPVPDGTLYTPPCSENTDTDCIDSPAHLEPFQPPAFQNPVTDSIDSVSFDITPYSSGSSTAGGSDPPVYEESSEPVETQSPVGECTNPVPDDTSLIPSHSENPETDCIDVPVTLEPSQSTDGDSTNCVPFATGSNSFSCQFPETGDSDPPVYLESSEPVVSQSPVEECTNPVPDDTSLIPSHSENPETYCINLPVSFEPSQTTDGESTDCVPFATASNSFSCQFPETGDSDLPVYLESSEPVVSQSPVRDNTDFVPIATTSDDLSGGQSPVRSGSDPPVESLQLSNSPTPVIDCEHSIPGDTTFIPSCSPVPSMDRSRSPSVERSSVLFQPPLSPGFNIDLWSLPMTSPSPDLESLVRGGSTSPVCVEFSHLSKPQSPAKDNTDFIPSATISCSQTPHRSGANSPESIESFHLSRPQSPARDNTDFTPAAMSNLSGSQTPDRSDSNSPVSEEFFQPSTSEIPEPTSQPTVISSSVLSQLPKDNICPIHFTHSAVLILDRTRLQRRSTVSLERYELIEKKLHSVGHAVSEEGVRPNLKTLKFLQRCSPPSNFRQLQSFLCLSRYCRRFVKGFAEIVRPLNTLSKLRDEPFTWTETEQNSFMALKRAFTTEPILHYPDFNESFILAVECSYSAISSVLSQGDLDNSRVLGYGSRDLAESEEKLSTTEKQLLAITWAVKHFNLYLEGQNFTIVTTHEPLAWLITCETLGGRLTRLRKQLLQHRFKLIYCDRKRATVFPATSSISPLCDISKVPESLEVLVKRRAMGKKAPKLEKLITKELSHTPYVLFYSKDMSYSNPLAHYFKSNFDLTKVNESEHLYDVVEVDNGVQTAYVCLSRHFHEERIRYLDILCSLISLRAYLTRQKYSGEIYIHDITTKYKHIERSAFSEMILFAFKRTNVKPVLVILKRVTPSFVERRTIFQEIHRTQPDKHFTYRETFNIIKERYRWRSMKTDIFNYIKRCRTCKERNT